MSETAPTPSIAPSPATPSSATLTASARPIAAKFHALSQTGEMGLVAYVTAGDPTLDATEKIVLAAVAAGADVIELGVPFSDPLADGPVIQRASERALRGGSSLRSVLELVSKLRVKTAVPLVLFSYYNPVLQMGLDTFAAAAAAAGASGVLITDVIPEESADHRAAMQSRGLDTIFLAAPTSTDVRLALIAQASSGFLYLISRTGVTGTRDALPAGLPELVRRVRAQTRLPIAVGFGVSQPSHVAVLGGIADAAVVGSAIVAAVEQSSSADAAAEAVGDLVGRLKRAGRDGVSRPAKDGNR
jgi:tryptophan synthase alpha chain